MKVKKILLMTLLSAGLALTSCGTDDTSNPGGSSESRTSESQTSSSQSKPSGSSSIESRDIVITSSSESSSQDAPHTHTYASEWSKDDHYHWHAATCEHTSEVKDKALHSFRDEIVRPTYETKGYTLHTCTICGYSYKDGETDELEHEYSDKWSYDDECHFHACLDDGYEDLVIDQGDHDFEAEVTDPTYSAGGYTTFTCTICGYSYKDYETEKLEHNYVWYWSFDENKHWHSCADAGFEDLKAGEANHNMRVEVVEPTFDRNGYTLHECTECDYYYVDNETDRLKHNYSDKWSYDYECHFHACLDDGYEDEVADEAAHTYGEWVIDKKATETEEGLKHKVCTVCGYSVYNTIDQLDHDWGTPTYKWSDDYSSCTATVVCANDTELDHVITETVDTVGHEYEEATCTEDGTYRYYAYFSKWPFDNQVKYVPIKATSHDWGEIKYTWATDHSTCTATRECANGNHPETETVEAKLEVKTAATATTDGEGKYVATFENTAFETQEYECVIDAIGTPEKLIFNLTQSGKSYFASAASRDIEGEVIVPANYNGLPVVSVSMFDDCSSVTSVVLGANVKTIAAMTFSFCTSLKSITIPDGLEEIEYQAFYNCISLESIVIPDTVTSIGSCCFFGCRSLKSMTIPFVGRAPKYLYGKRCFGDIFGGYSSYYYDGGVPTVQDKYTYYIPATLKEVKVTGYTIDQDSFVNCSTITSFTIGSGVTSLHYSALDFPNLESLTFEDNENGISIGSYKDCQYLKTVNLGKGISSIGNNAFYRCTSLATINIPDTVTSIGSYAFYYCVSLTSITIPSSVTSIDNYAFLYCNCLAEVVNKSALDIQVGTNNNGCAGLYAKEVIADEAYSNLVIDNNGFVTYDDGVDNWLIKYLGTDSEVAIPNTVTKIGEYAFYHNNKLTSITIPDTVTSIGGYAFETVSKLSSIVIPDSVTVLGNYAFQYCSGMVSVTIGSGITSIPNWTFSGCECLVEVINRSTLDIRTGWSNNGNVAYNAKQVITDKADSKLSTIDNDFIVYNDGVDVWLVSYTGDDSEVTIPDSVTKINRYAFNGNTKLTSVNLGSKITEMGYKVFAGCTSLKSITIPNTVTVISDSAFNGCTSLASVNLGSSTTSIGNSSFAGCTSLKSITIPGTVTSIDSNAFSRCSSLSSVVIPDSVTYLGSSAFKECIALKSLTIGTGITEIYYETFRKCTSLTSVIISDNITSIGYYAFRECTSLSSFTIGLGVTTIGDDAFDDCRVLNTLKYNGTKEQFQKIKLYSGWLSDVQATEVECSDGVKEL